MDDIVQILNEINIPFAYSHFAEGESPFPPFICYRIPDTNNFSADGVAYCKFNLINIELYTDKKDIALEQRIEDIFFNRNIFYNKSETWISSEKLYEILYTFELKGE